MLQHTLSPADYLLLRESVARHRRDCLPFVDRIGAEPLQEPVREDLREAVVAELAATGLAERDEPNRRGRRLEHVIDVLGRL